MNFWEEFWGADNSKVHTPQAILLFIAGILILLAVAILIYHCFWKGKGLDAEVVKLFGILLGGGVLNAGASYFSKTVISSVTGAVGGNPTVPAKKPPPVEEGETL